ncbi:MAG: aminotransferase [Hyphomonadaceae bacterium]|nr:aminotransferase [Hyphomonadaceae bacterium]
MNSVYAALKPTIFTLMSGLANELDAVNLGQGFPEEDGPRDIREAAARACLDGPNQYPPMQGLPTLREAVAAHYRAHQDVALDWKSEITITSGATEAIAAAILCAIEPGDEVVLIEPMYDSYLPMVLRGGGVPRFIRLEPPHWRISEAQLEAAFTPKTRAIVLNTPINPAAAVMSHEDLALIARYCKRYNAIAIADEVWEHVLFDGRTHASMLQYLRERTIKIGSAGKMFSMTGWKVGFACAAPELTTLFAKAHQFLTFTTPPNLQSAVAYGLGKERAYFEDMRAGFQRSRDRLAQALRQEGFALLPSEGAYFLSIDLPRSGIGLSDEEFALRAVKEFGVAVIPYAPFYAEPGSPPLVRLCFAKKDETLDRGVERLAKARRAML